MSESIYCACGCGEITKTTKHDNKALGMKAGDHYRFVNGHYHKMMRRQNPSWGKQMDRQRMRDKIRDEMIELARPKPGRYQQKLSIERFRLLLAPGLPLESISLLYKSAQKWYPSLRLPDLKLRHPRDSNTNQEQLYEFATELHLEDHHRRKSIDAPVREDSDLILLDLLPSQEPNPLEALMEKEEAEMENKYESRAWRIEEFNRWLERRKWEATSPADGSA